MLSTLRNQQPSLQPNRALIGSETSAPKPAVIGIKGPTLDTALTTVVEPLPRIIELDRSQPEFAANLSGYMRNRVSDRRIERGRRLLAEHKDLSAEIHRNMA